tara:strand:- start:1372 stop:2433 length:1062 start_codon:yes stop_codon:yes gene_type:complete
MNKFYGILVLFAISGLILPSAMMTTEAASNLDYMLIIAENAKSYVKSKIDKMNNSNSRILDLYGQSNAEIDKLSVAIKNGDVKSARDLFVSSMSKLKQVSVMLNQLEISKSQDDALPDHSQIIKRYEMNYQKLQQISKKLDANIDFSEMEGLLSLAKQNVQKENTEKTKQAIDQIALKGFEIYKTLQSLNEQNKIIRAQALAEKYVDRINALIVEAKTSGLLDYVQKLENSKTLLIASNNTAQITKNIRIVITINNDIKEINKNNLQQINIDEIRLSQTQRIVSELNQLETNAKLLQSDAKESKAALYYVQKALAIIDNIRNNIDDPKHKTDAKIELVEKLLSKVSKILQEST